MIEFEAKILDVIQRTPDVKSFRLSAAEEARFKPGQFFTVTIAVEGEKATKHFSFSNSPTEKGYIEFTKRITGSPFSKALDRLNPGDITRIKMPFGSFTFEGEHERIAFLSGGIGITPIRSMCRYAADKELSTDIILIYSNRDAGDIAFREDFDRMQAANRGVRVIYTLTQEPEGTGWNGRIGRIDDEMIKAEIPDYRERVFYTCGPPKMVEGIVSVLKDKLGLEETAIKRENFTGY